MSEEPNHELVSMEELAAFCFGKLSSLEARFIILCHRAHAAGIDCSDLCGKFPPLNADAMPGSPLTN